jgi:DnaJ-class molecular chaperone
MADQQQRNGIVSELVACAICKGTGVREAVPCRACGGVGSVEVVKPAIPCPRCDGTGKGEQAGPGHALQTCVVCQGAGWALRISGAAG